MRKLLTIMALFVLSILVVSLVSASTLDDADGLLRLTGVEVNGKTATVYDQATASADVIDDLNGVRVKEGETLEVEVDLEALSSTGDIQVEVEVRGYEYSDEDDLDDRSEQFDLEVSGTGTTSDTVDLEVTLPQKLDKDRYFLRITVDNKDSASLIRYVVLQIEPSTHGVDFARVVFTPYTNTVEAGRSLNVNALLRNFGERDEKDVQVTATIPALGVRAYDSVKVVPMDDHNIDYTDVAELWLKIPASAAAGSYEVVLEAQFNDLRDSVRETHTINVVPNTRLQPETKDTLVLAVGPENQNVAAGATATYAVALTNAGQASKAYTVEVVTGDWATSQVSESLVVLESGKNKVVYVTVAASEDAAVGPQVVSVSVKDGSETLKTVNLQANVTEGPGNSLRNGLEIALIVLVVLLVIIGLIIGFARLRKDNEEEEQTYY